MYWNINDNRFDVIICIDVGINVNRTRANWRIRKKSFLNTGKPFLPGGPIKPCKLNNNNKKWNEKIWKTTKKCNCTFGVFIVSIKVCSMHTNNNAKNVETIKNTKLLIYRLLQFICKVDFEYRTKCVAFGGQRAKNNEKINKFMRKSLLTGGPVSPESPFFPFLPRLPGGPGGPMCRRTENT